MDKKIAFSMLLGSAVMLTGCGKKMNQFAADYFTTNPNPLEVVGQNVPATVTGNIPPKFFVKNASVTVTPYLTFNGTELAGSSMTFQGEKVNGNNRVISYDNGGTVTIPVNYVYQPEMQKSELYLDFAVEQKGKQYVLPRVKVADGIIATASLASAETVAPATAADKFQRIINEQYKADILFLINVAKLRDSELKSQKIQEWNEKVAAASAAENREIKELNIESYASPDGPYDFNAKLAEQRENNTKGYLEKQIKNNGINFGELTANFTPEDWEGFQKLVSESNIQDKDLILSVLKMYKDPETRDREIHNMSNVFDELAETILPQLRYSRLTASVDVIGKSDAEINKAFDNEPSTLTVDELLYAATLTNDLNRKKAIYAAATKYYPNDYRGYNNLGNILYQQGDFDAALDNYKKSAKLNPSAPEAQMGQGLVALVNNDFKAANQAFGKAGGLEELGSALGVYYLEQGDVNAAVKAFGNDKSNNAALAQILSKDYSKAKSTLAGIKTPDATTYYLSAVLGARTNNEQMVISNLGKAVKLDKSLAAKAANDLEFANFNISSAL